MEKIDEQLNNISLVEVPIEIHQNIMRRVNYKKLKPVFFITFMLLVINFMVVVWHINSKLIEVEFTDMVKDFFEVFSFDFSFINTILGSFFEIISPLVVISAVSSLVAMVYLGKKINLFYFAKV